MIYLETSCDFHYKTYLAYKQRITVIFLLSRELIGHKYFTNVYRTVYHYAMRASEEIMYVPVQ